MIVVRDNKVLFVYLPCITVVPGWWWKEDEDELYGRRGSTTGEGDLDRPYDNNSNNNNKEEDDE